MCILRKREMLIFRSREDIMKSITEKLLKLPDETIVYPGHGKPTRIGDEKRIYLELKPKQ